MSFDPSSFTPTVTSIPPPHAGLRLKQTTDSPVNLHPLVRNPSTRRFTNAVDFHSCQNPLDFILRAAEIYPDKLALVHPDIAHPVFYSFATWSVSRSIIQAEL
jgi:hypothetical protein